MNLPDPDEDHTGLPGVTTWLAVYLLVFESFLLWVGLLTLLTRLFP